VKKIKKKGRELSLKNRLYDLENVGVFKKKKPRTESCWSKIDKR